MGLVLESYVEQKGLPNQIISELNIILDESQPLPKRVSLLIKWYYFIKTYLYTRHEVKLERRLPPPKIEELTPSRLREYAQALVEEVAYAMFYSK